MISTPSLWAGKIEGHFLNEILNESKKSPQGAIFKSVGESPSPSFEMLTEQMTEQMTEQKFQAKLTLK